MHYSNITGELGNLYNYNMFVSFFVSTATLFCVAILKHLKKTLHIYPIEVEAEI